MDANKLQTIDDILNDSDDDDDTTDNNVGHMNLEDLLDQDDDAVDDLDVTLYNRTKFINSSDEPAMNLLPTNRELFAVTNEKTPSDDLYQEDVVMDALREVSIEENNVLHKLEIAEKREQKFLTSVSREIVSVLNSKNNATSCIEQELMSEMSSQLQRNSENTDTGVGVATVIHAHLKYIAIGTAHGLIILFDYMQEIRQALKPSLQSANLKKPPASITAIDTVATGNYLIAANSSGDIFLWDVLKGSIIKHVTSVHDCSIHRINFMINLAESSHTIELNVDKVSVPVESEFVAISIDANGVVNRTRFSKALSLFSMSSEVDCLLDGSAGVVYDMKSARPIHDFNFQGALLSSSSTNDNVSVGYIADNKLVALTTNSKTFIIQVHPIVRIMYRWSILNHTDVNASSAIVQSLDWGWVKRNNFSKDTSIRKAEPVLYRSRGSILECITISYEQTASSGVKPIDHLENYKFTVGFTKSFVNQNIISVRVVSDYQITIYTETDIFVLSSSLEILDHCSLSTAIVKMNRSILNQSNAGVNFSSWLSGIDQSIYILENETVWKCTAQLWIEKVELFVINGKWLECLGLLVENYESVSKTLSETGRDILAFYIKKYLQLTISSYIIPDIVIPENHFLLVAGICIDICYSVKRLDLLFGSIYDTFKSTLHQNIFLKSLEPYILSRKIIYLPFQVMTDLFSYALNEKRLHDFERLICYLDVASVDVQGISKLLLENNLYSSVLYTRGYGFGSTDLPGAFEVVFESICMNEFSTDFKFNRENLSQHFINLTYKLILFLKYAVIGKIFPRGEAINIPPSRLSHLIELIVTETYPKKDSSDSNLGVLASKLGDFPYLNVLSSVDIHALFHSLALGVDIIQNSEEIEIIPFLLESVYKFCLKSNESSSFTNIFFYTFKAQIISCKVQLKSEILIQFSLYLKTIHKSHLEAEDLIIEIAQNQSKFYQYDKSDGSDFVNCLKDGGFWRAVCTFYKFSNRKSSKNFNTALTFYFSLFDNQNSNKVQQVSQIFNYLDSEYELLTDSTDDLDTVVVSFITKLVVLDINLTKSLCKRKLLGRYKDLFASLNSYPAFQFEIINSMVDDVIKNPAKSIAEVFQPEDIFQYIKLLVVNHPDMVYHFVSTNDHFPLDDCIRLCRDNGILDAAAVLTEKTGNIDAALEMLLIELSNRLRYGKSILDEILDSTDNKKHSDEKKILFNILSNSFNRNELSTKLGIYKQLDHLTNSICSLCSRNSCRSNSNLWFVAFDYILAERSRLIFYLNLCII